MADRSHNPAPHAAELDRIRAEYDRRARELPADFYSKDRPANLFLRHGQERALVQLLAEAGQTPLAGKRLLDVGSGEGDWLALFEGMGARRADLAGIDLDPARVAAATARLPGADVRPGDAGALPWADASFDLVSQFTVFTSILDGALKRRVAAEMTRVLKPGGRIVWYDFSYDNPRNKNVRGVSRRELAALFPGARFMLRRTTLAPPIARRLVPRSWTAAALIESLGVLNTHWLGLIEPRGR
jgi:ubiquinone/menaquinone biosynthesis C-methylase UbiE